jgi:hypothetical protein
MGRILRVAAALGQPRQYGLSVERAGVVEPELAGVN